MKDLLKWQFISFTSRGLAMVIGIVQSIVIVRILSISEYGLVTLATSIGGAFGIYQHLGLASGSTREISSAKSEDEIFKIFVTSSIIRYIVSVPLAIILFFYSDYLSITQYENADLILPLKIFSFILLIQGVQSIFNSVISGMQKFKQLFLYQVGIAALGLFIYIPLIYFYKVNGYFYSLAIFNIFASIILGYIALKPLKEHLIWPSKDDIKRLSKDILSISLGIYFVKIIYTYWQKSGPLLLGLNYSAEEIGLFGFALLYAGKLMIVSDSITDVSLPVLSKKFIEDFNEFKLLFTDNFNKVISFILFSAVSAVFWSKEIFHLLLGGNKYDGSLPYIFPLVFSFVFYSIVNIVKSSILIPAKFVKEMLISFIFMLGTTVFFYIMTKNVFGGLNSMAYAMVSGAFVGVVFTVVTTLYKLKFIYIDKKILLLIALSILISIFSLKYALLIKVLLYILYVVFYTICLFLFGIVKKTHIAYILTKLKILKS